MLSTPPLPLISIIVPVYNTERYLRRCLDSILCQTPEEIEVIVVNDATQDDSHKIIDEYIQKDNKVRSIVHSENRGLVGVRNTGIEATRSQYLQFVDSDDYIHPKMCRNLYQFLREHGLFRRLQSSCWRCYARCLTNAMYFSSNGKIYQQVFETAHIFLQKNLKYVQTAQDDQCFLLLEKLKNLDYCEYIWQEINTIGDKYDQVRSDSWYRFGRLCQLFRKGKLCVIGKTVVKQLRVYWLSRR